MPSPCQLSHTVSALQIGRILFNEFQFEIDCLDAKQLTTDTQSIHGFVLLLCLLIRCFYFSFDLFVLNHNNDNKPEMAKKIAHTHLCWHCTIKATLLVANNWFCAAALDINDHLSMDLFGFSLYQHFSVGIDVWLFFWYGLPLLLLLSIRKIINTNRKTCLAMDGTLFPPVSCVFRYVVTL